MGSNLMALVLLGLFALTLYLMIRLGAAAAAWMLGARYWPYRQLAARYRGRFESRGFAEPPTVSFGHNGSNVRVGLAPQVAGKPQVTRTRVVARFSRGLPFRFELAPISRPAPNQPPKGTRLVRVGDQEFDRGYVIQANDPEMARAFLTASVRWAIANLERLGPPGGMLISINPERLLVQVDRDLGLSGDGLAHVVYEALIIHDGLRQGVAARLSEGIAIIAAGPAAAEDSGPPICKVCGEEIVAPGVFCETCKTPHHRDCWEFVGACSIYGCNGKKSIPA
jgi:RING finger family protein